MLKFLDLSGANVCTSCRSRQELFNEYLLAKFGVDTAENEPCKVCPISLEKMNKLIKLLNPLLTDRPGTAGSPSPPLGTGTLPPFGTGTLY